MDKAIFCHAGGCHSGDPLAGLRAPIGAHIVEAGSGAGDQGAQHHRHAVQSIVLCGKGRGGLFAVPVKAGSHNGLGKVRIGQPVGPVALPLEAAGNGVLAQSLLVPAHFVQLGIAVENGPHDHGHLGDERPVLVRVYHLGLANDLRQVLTGVAVKALFAVGLDPAQRFVKLVMIVNAQGDPAHNLGHIYPLGTNAKVFLEHFRVAEAAGNTHGNAAQVHIGLVLHPAYCSGSVGKAQDLLCHIGRDLFVRHILHIMAVNGEGRQS